MNILMITFFLAKTGVKAYVVISAIVTLGWLGFMFVVLKHGYMFGSRIVILKENSPTKFYVNIGLLLLGYGLMILFSFGLYLQKIGYLGGN